MAIETVCEGAVQRILVGESMTISEAEALQNAFVLSLATSKSLEVDLSTVENVDIAGIQLLLALEKSPSAVVFLNPSPVVRKFARMLGLQSLMHRLGAAAEAGHG